MFDNRVSPKLLLILAFLLLAISGCGATPMQTVDDTLLGEWSGEAMVRPPVSFSAPPKETPRPPEEPVDIHITIHEDATVTGNVGGAELKDCVLKSNRNELGRQLNVASDYIIMDGYLDGPIIEGDEELGKHFTIPFNLTPNEAAEERMRGSVMWLEGMKYPSPLLRADLGR